MLFYRKQCCNNLFKGFIPVIYNNKKTHLEGIMENVIFFVFEGWKMENKYKILNI